MRGVRITLVLAVFLLALCAGAQAAPQGKWEAVGRGGLERPVGEIGLVRLGDTLQVVWVRRTGGNAYDLVHTPISAAGKVGNENLVVEGWAQINHAALVGQGKTLHAFFPGAKTTATEEPFFGLNLATSPDGGASWSVYGAGSIFRDEYAYGRPPSVAWAQNGAFEIQTWNGTARQVVHAGLDNAPAIGYYGPTVCCSWGQNIATDGSTTWLAWCTQNDAPSGRWVQGVDPAGVPNGSPTLLAGSEGVLCESTRLPLVARPGGGFYVADSAAPGGKKVVLWSVGGGKPVVVSSGSDARSRVALAAAPDGRLWVAWRTFQDAATLHARRSNKAGTRFGAEVTAKAPAGAVQIDHVDLSAQTGRADVLADFGFADPGQNNVFHTQLLPGLTLTAKAGKVVRFQVTDAGDPVAGAAVKVGGTTVRTNAKGIATADLPAGRFTAAASKAGYVGASARVRSL